MKRDLRKAVGFLGLLALATSLSIGLTACPSIFPTTNGSSNRKVVNVDANLPMSGPLAIYGSSIRDGAVMAIEDLEKENPVTPLLKLDWQDNASEPKNTVSIWQKQSLDSPDIYISGLKPQASAIADQVTAKGIPHFLWLLDAFINKNSTNNLRTWVNYKIEAPLYLNYAKQIKAKRVAILYTLLPNTSEQFNTLVIPELKKQGIDQIFVEPFKIDTNEFRDIAVKIKNFKPDLIILNGFQGELVAQVRALRPLGLIKEGNTIATFDMLSTIDILGADELEGILVTSPLFVSRSDIGAIKQWRERFKSKYNREPIFTNAFGYDMIVVINDAAKRLQIPATSKQWIEAIRATNAQGVTGTLAFDEDGTLITPLEVGVFRGGKVVPLAK
jgi:branched-chain amino acid transport system substrate-binding protein